MNVTISLDFDSLKEDIKNEYINRLIDLGYTEAQIKVLEDSFDSNIDGGFMDATFSVEMNRDETEVTACILVGG